MRQPPGPPAQHVRLLVIGGVLLQAVECLTLLGPAGQGVEHLFLERRYGKIDVVFIRHTHEAKEVDEEPFFYSRETGGTSVSTALVEMRKIMKDRYPPHEWNIYAAQASDGDDWSGDAEKCVEILENDLMPYCQYYSYVEILDEREMETFANEENGAELWRAEAEDGAPIPKGAEVRVTEVRGLTLRVERAPASKT